MCHFDASGVELGPGRVGVLRKVPDIFKVDRSGTEQCGSTHRLGLGLPETDDPLSVAIEQIRQLVDDDHLLKDAWLPWTSAPRLAGLPPTPRSVKFPHHSSQSRLATVPLCAPSWDGARDAPRLGISSSDESSTGAAEPGFEFEVES